MPDGHPRLAADATILAECACVADTCHMDCPTPATATVNDTQVKYDFKVFSTFITDAYGTGPAFPVAGTTPAIVHPSQRSAIRVMPWSDYNSNLPSSLSPPSWLFESCCAGGVCGDALHTGTWSTHAWSLLDPAHAVWRAQIAHLVSALAGEDADLTVGAAPTPAGDGTTFLGFDDDPRVFSVDIGAVGTYGEWSLFGAGDWRIGAGLTYAEGWDPVCLTAGDVTLDEASWWADLIDPWNTSFAHEGGWPRPHIVGKLVYPDVLDEADADTCYLPNEYVVGRRGTHAEGDPAGGYTGQRNGVRYDNWGQIDIVDDYHGGTQAAPAMASQAWRRSSFQAEQWQNFHDMMSMDADPLSPTEVERYGIWDLEETVRFSIARRLSLFRWPVPIAVLPPGTFQFSYDSFNWQRSEATLTRPFAIATTETTVEDWTAFMGYDPTFWKTEGPRRPVENVSLSEALRFANALSAADGLPLCYPCGVGGDPLVCTLSADPYACTGYRLPTEVEWDYAASEGGRHQAPLPDGGTFTPWAADTGRVDVEVTGGAAPGSTLGDQCWYAITAAHPMPVASLRPNSVGLYDMCGNVHELVDGYWFQFSDALLPATVDYYAPLDELVVRRGGSVQSSDRHATIQERGSFLPQGRRPYVGFRIARTLPAVEAS